MDEGNLTIPQDVKIGYLSQITFLDEHRTVHEELLDVFKYVREIENQLNQQAKVLETNSSEKELEKYALLQHKFESLNG